MRTRIITALAASTAAAALGASPALAGPDNGKGARFDISDHGACTIVATCADGATVTGPMDGEAVMHERFDQDGNLVQMSLNMEYRMTWTLSTAGESVYPHGTRRLVFDFVDGTITESGSYRLLTVAGQGSVLKWAGRTLMDLDSNIIDKVGPAIADWHPETSDDLVCAVFGQEGPDQPRRRLAPDLTP